MWCSFKLPEAGKYPDSVDPEVYVQWVKALGEERYDDLGAAWRNQNSFILTDEKEKEDG